MSNRNFRELLEKKWVEGKFVCIGLDTDPSKTPEDFRCMGGAGNIITAFNQAIVNVTKDLVCAYKPNTAFYEAHGDEGIAALRATIKHINSVAPDVPVILDAKRADIGNTNAGYVDMAFKFMNADAITVHPYLGAEALQPFLAQKDKGVFVLCRTSNPGAGEFQDIECKAYRRNLQTDMVDSCMMKMYELVAHRVAVTSPWIDNGNCGLVVGATYPEELVQVRKIVGDVPILIPGIGAQGGDVEKTVLAGKDSRGRGMIINSSRGIIFASKGNDFAEAARRETEKLHQQITQHLKGGVS